ncbi:unnamed protein product [Cyprideis torosa]|uniref:Uncharacterized protein n=1 Tax=Cyprideis torosa TaxID=163714 RepID=A0A7R8ZP64_9CRUS|nr:unnamed protein product [Cyprideis torosa]CAG0893197.1 unnamed protein product [Cyprideis torosa]
MTWREQTYRRRAHEQRMMPSDAPGRDVHSGPGPPGFQTHEFYGGMMLGNQNQEPACFQQKDWNHLSQSAWYQYYPSNQSYFYQQQGQYQRHCQVYSSVSESSTNNRPCSTYSSGYGSSISSEEMLTSPSSSSGSCQLQETSDPRTPVAPPIRNTSSSNGEQTGSFQNKRNHNDECEDSASLCSFGKLDSGIGSVDDPSSVLSNGSFASSATKARSSSRCESVRSETADSTCSSLSSLEGNGPATSTPFSSASVNSFSMNGMCGTSTLSADNHSQQSTPYMVPPPSVDGSCSNPASQMSCFDDLEEGGSTTDPGFNSYGNGSASVLVVSSASGVVSERFGGMSVMASGSGEKSAGEGGATSGSAYGHPESSGGTPDSHVRKSGAQDVTLSSPIRVPHRWKREVNHSAVIYTSQQRTVMYTLDSDNPSDSEKAIAIAGFRLDLSRPHRKVPTNPKLPSNIKLKSLKEVTNYLLSDGTCKCGLTCPLNVEQVFNFDPKRPSRPTLLADVAGHPKMCGHRRRLLRDLSALPQIVAQQRQIREQQLSQAAAATASPAAAEETTLPVPPSTQSKGARAGTTKSKGECSSACRLNGGGGQRPDHGVTCLPRLTTRPKLQHVCEIV